MSESWSHLVVRFFDVVSAPALDRGDHDRVGAWLREGERAMFFDQPAADQRHGLESAHHVALVRPDRLDLIRAALLHDVGKRHARLGVLGRVLASLIIRLSLPLPKRVALYREHGPVGAADLAAAGAEDVVVAFARAHHASKPPQIELDDWQVMVASDRAKVRRENSTVRYPAVLHQLRRKRRL